MAKSLELIGQYMGDSYVFQADDPEQRTVIGTLADGSVVKGRAQVDQLEYGLTYRFVGRWVEHYKHGSQFHFTSLAKTMPVGERGTVPYLSRAHGIGTMRARAIWKQYGTDSLEVLRTDPERVAREISGITSEIAHAASEQFIRDQRLETVTLELAEILDGKGLPRTIPNSLIVRFGAAAAEELRRNPFILQEFPGVGFARADKIYLELGGDPSSLERQARCAVYALHKDSDGHTWYPLSFLKRAVTEKITGAGARPVEAIKLAMSMELLVHRRIGEQDYFAERNKALSEDAIAAAILLAELEMHATLSKWPNLEDILGLEDEQRRELARALRGRIGILAGRPGTGKTYTLARLIEAIERLNLGSYVVCAPTGKAAVRIAEALRKAGLTVPTATIHSTLRVVNANGGWRFEHDASNPLPVDFIFVDESSMIDADLMASLLSARDEGTHVLFVGDPDQLSPVGHGAPLRDMLKARVASGHLKEIHRNGGRIVKCCKEIAERQTYTPSKTIDLDCEEPENLLHIEKETPEEQVAELFRLLDSLPVPGLDRVWDVQVLVTVNDKGPLARRNINAILQERLNEHGTRVEGNRFRVGDKLICLVNSLLERVDDQEPALRAKLGFTPSQERAKAYVANGELGEGVEVAPGYTIARIPASEARVRIPRGKEKEDEEGQESNSSWDLGYGITVHKSQGSEWPLVIVLVDGSAGARRVCDRHHIYTALSRPKLLGITIGQKRVIDQAIRRSNMWLRRTLLVESILERRQNYLGQLWEADLKGLLA